MKVLFSESNKSGAFLEVLLNDICSDIIEKQKRIDGVNHIAAENYINSNSKIIELLEEAARIQQDAIEFAKKNPIPTEMLK